MPLDRHPPDLPGQALGHHSAARLPVHATYHPLQTTPPDLYIYLSGHPVPSSVRVPNVVVVIDLPLLRVAVEGSDNPVSLEKPCQASLPPDQQGRHSLGRHPEVQYVA